MEATTKWAKCLKCTLHNQVSGNTLSYRCLRCKMINCLMCDKLHDNSCEIFKNSNNNYPVRPAPLVPANNMAHLTVKRPITSPNKFVIKNVCTLSNDKVEQKDVFKTPRMNCPICNITISSSGYNRHSKSKMHITNIRNNKKN